MSRYEYQVLVAEDEPIILNDTVFEIENAEMGFHVKWTAYNGKDALDMIKTGCDIYGCPDVGDGWIRDDRGIAEKRDILQNCGYKFLPGIPLCETCDGAWCRRFSGQTVESLRSA